jgi:ATP-dependent DNA helicase MPH1
MMAKNPHFRILALTATPGSNPEAVQDLIDGLHISRVEIRDENSLDLKAYLHEKVSYIIYLSTLLTDKHRRHRLWTNMSSR